jgi:hypothetical protein
MKMTYFIVSIIIIVGLIFYFVKNSNKTPPSENITSNKPLQNDNSPKDNPYEGLRNMALNVTPEQLQLAIPNDQTKAYGVVMDLDLGKGIGTFISFETGDASMYLSSGGGMIGGQKHPNVQATAKAFVSIAQTYLDKMLKVDSTPLPDKNCVRFYLLTNKGKFSGQEKLENIDNNSSPWIPLFVAGNKVANELSKTERKE